jgi:TPP-dependent pyruvate/acetoin dehydrogenase alpha subunit
MMEKKEKLQEMLYMMLKIRRVEERLMDIFAQGRIPECLLYRQGRNLGAQSGGEEAWGNSLSGTSCKLMLGR